MHSIGINGGGTSESAGQAEQARNLANATYNS